MRVNKIVKKLSKGWELRNHGQGWWLNPPHDLRNVCGSIRLDDKIVEAMDEKGLIDIEIPHTLLIATLSAA